MSVRFFFHWKCIKISHEWLRRLREQNPWWSKEIAINNDPLIQRYNQGPVHWIPALFHKIQLNKGLILTLRGPRQVGKTTLVKLLVKKLLEEVSARDICYMACDLVDSPQNLVDLIRSYLRWREEINPELQGYLFLDEVSGVTNWQRGIKSLIDEDVLGNYCVLLTGSNALALTGGPELLPGRRGMSTDPIDKILVPMKFSEYVMIRNSEIKELLWDHPIHGNICIQGNREEIWKKLLEGHTPACIQDFKLFNDRLFQLFNEYLITGGIIRALQEYVKTSKISQSTFNDYVSVTIGDILHAGKNKEYLQQILQQVFKSLTNSLGFQTITKEIDVGSKNTVKDYITLLNNVFVLSTVFQVNLNKKQAKFKSDKKILAQDPFIFHALNDWVCKGRSAWQTAMTFLDNPEDKSKLVESIVHNHLIRFLYNNTPHDLFDPTQVLWFWRSQKGYEVDCVFNIEMADWVPIEVKYQKNFSRGDLKGLSTFLSSTNAKRGLIATLDRWKIESNWTQIPVHYLLLLI